MAEIDPHLDVSTMDLPRQPWVAIVGNPFSGSGRNQLAASHLAALLEQQSIPSLTVWDRAQRSQLFRHPRIAHTCKCIVVAGGDGTVADVMSEQPAVPLAALPLGNENLLAKEFGFTAGPEQLVAAIVRGEHRPLDLGVVGERRFSLMLTVGLDAEVVHRVAAWRHNGDRTRRIAHRSYVRPGIGALLGYQYPHITLEADGRSVSGALAMVFNLPRYALGLPFMTDACGDDGELDWIVFEKPGLLRSMSYGLSVWRNRHRQHSEVHTGRAASIRISSDMPAPMQIDGDPCGHTPVNVGVLRHAVRVVVA